MAKSNFKSKKIITISSDSNLWNYLARCIQYRGLVWALVKKDLKVKYAQTRLGILLSLLQPVTGLIVFSYFFGNLLKIGTDGSPYPIFVFTGMITWYYFSLVVAYSGSSLIESQHIIKKVNFPKLIIPFSKSISALMEFFIWMTVLIVLMIIYKVAPTYRLLFLPFFLVLNMMLGLTVGIWLSALSFKRRDILHVVPYFVGLTMMATPVFYPKTLIPQQYDYLMDLNPIAGILQGFRWCISGSIGFSWVYLPVYIIIFIIFILSLLYFTKVEYRMAEQL
jgi:lipopolysaccharide transport system permease protein